MLGKDQQDSVRLLVVEVAASLATSFRTHGMGDKNLELVKPIVLGTSFVSSSSRFPFYLSLDIGQFMKEYRPALPILRYYLFPNTEQFMNGYRAALPSCALFSLSIVLSSDLLISMCGRQIVACALHGCQLLCCDR